MKPVAAEPIALMRDVVRFLKMGNKAWVKVTNADRKILRSSHKIGIR